MNFTKFYKGMTNNSYQNIKSLINNTLSKIINYRTLKESRKKFLTTVLICFSCIKGKINFLQLERFSDNREQYFRINFESQQIEPVSVTC